MSLGFGHPSRYQPRSTGFNFGEQTGTGVFPEGTVMKCFVIYPFRRMNNLAASFSKKVFFCVPNYIIISSQVTSPRTMKTTSLTRIYSNLLQSLIPE